MLLSPPSSIHSSSSLRPHSQSGAICLHHPIHPPTRMHFTLKLGDDDDDLGPDFQKKKAAAALRQRGRLDWKLELHFRRKIKKARVLLLFTSFQVFFLVSFQQMKPSRRLDEVDMMAVRWFGL